MLRFNFAHGNFLNEFITAEFPKSYEKNYYGAEITDKIIHNFPDNIDEDKIACELEITKRWLQKRCSKAFGITFKRLIRILRIYFALRLLQETTLDNFEIALNLNYTEEGNMARDFRIELHICPTEARRRLVAMNPKQLFDSLWQR